MSFVNNFNILVQLCIFESPLEYLTKRCFYNTENSNPKYNKNTLKKTEKNPQIKHSEQLPKVQIYSNSI